MLIVWSYFLYASTIQSACLFASGFHVIVYCENTSSQKTKLPILILTKPSKIILGRAVLGNDVGLNKYKLFFVFSTCHDKIFTFKKKIR